MSYLILPIPVGMAGSDASLVALKEKFGLSKTTKSKAPSVPKILLGQFFSALLSAAGFSLLVKLFKSIPWSHLGRASSHLIPLDMVMRPVKRSLAPSFARKQKIARYIVLTGMVLMQAHHVFKKSNTPKNVAFLVAMIALPVLEEYNDKILAIHLCKLTKIKQKYAIQAVVSPIDAINTGNFNSKEIRNFYLYQHFSYHALLILYFSLPHQKDPIKMARLSIILTRIGFLSFHSSLIFLFYCFKTFSNSDSLTITGDQQELPETFLKGSLDHKEKAS